jgi:hypothetical protein
MAKEYTTHLEEEKKRLTIAGDFEGARAYADEIDRISKREEEQAAIRLVTAVDVRKPSNGGTNATAATVTGDCRIHNGPNPPPVEGVEMERQSMMGPRMGGRISKIDVNAEFGVRNNTVEEQSHSVYSRTKTESGADYPALQQKFHRPQPLLCDPVADGGATHRRHGGWKNRPGCDPVLPSGFVAVASARAGFSNLRRAHFRSSAS